MKKFTAFILVLPLLSISYQSVIACTSILASPANLCIEVEDHNPKSEEFKTCMFELLDMDPTEYSKRYDPCFEGVPIQIWAIKEYSPEIKKIILEIEKDYSKKTEKENNEVK